MPQRAASRSKRRMTCNAVRPRARHAGPRRLRPLPMPGIIRAAAYHPPRRPHRRRGRGPGVLALCPTGSYLLALCPTGPIPRPRAARYRGGSGCCDGAPQSEGRPPGAGRTATLPITLSAGQTMITGSSPRYARKTPHDPAPGASWRETVSVDCAIDGSVPGGNQLPALITARSGPPHNGTYFAFGAGVCQGAGRIATATVAAAVSASSDSASASADTGLT